MSIDRVWRGLAASMLQRTNPMPGKPTRLPTLGRMPAHPLIPYAETTISRDARGQCRRCATMERQSLKVQGNELVERFKELVHEGNVRRIIKREDGDTVAEFPLTVG